MKIKYYFLLGTISFALFLIVNTPAAIVINAVEDKIPHIKFQNVSGTIWQGSAQQITVQSKHVLKNVDWSICAAHLLLAEACVKIDLSYNKDTFKGQLSIGVDKNIQAKNINAIINARTLSQLISLPLGEIDGEITLNLTSLNWQPGNIPTANGEIKWNKASITVAETAQLGDILINLSETDQHPINATINNKNGQLAISGTAVIDSNTDYSLQLDLKLNKTASENLKNSLGFFAKAQSNGNFKVNNSGNLKKLGLI